MEAITKIAYLIAAVVMAWLVLCGIVVITTGDTVGIHDITEATVAVVDALVEAIGDLWPTIQQSTNP